MPTLELNFEVYCECGNGLCGNSTEGHNRHSQFIVISPCEKCLNASYEQGLEEGYAECAECEKDNTE
uniref:Uncharacterized protein n=1 Tax=viral metagenome TaxID=1070528 RepID=A0A6M3JTM4_9ZZZZ